MKNEDGKGKEGTQWEKRQRRAGQYQMGKMSNEHIPKMKGLQRDKRRMSQVVGGTEK